MRQATHRTIAAVTDDVERWSYNTAVAHCMEHLNLLQRYARAADGPHERVWAEAADALLALLAPLTPHVTAELWEQRHPGEPSVHLQSWPVFDPNLTRAETVTMVIQVNGKLRDRIEVSPRHHAKSEAETVALASPNVAEATRRPNSQAGGGSTAPAGQHRRVGGVHAPSARSSTSGLRPQASDLRPNGTPSTLTASLRGSSCTGRRS